MNKHRTIRIRVKECYADDKIFVQNADRIWLRFRLGLACSRGTGVAATYQCRCCCDVEPGRLRNGRRSGTKRPSVERSLRRHSPAAGDTPALDDSPMKIAATALDPLPDNHPDVASSSVDVQITALREPIRSPDATENMPRRCRAASASPSGRAAPPASGSRNAAAAALAVGAAAVSSNAQRFVAFIASMIFIVSTLTRVTRFRRSITFSLWSAKR